jgi:hypothetical protein
MSTVPAFGLRVMGSLRIGVLLIAVSVGLCLRGLTLDLVFQRALEDIDDLFAGMRVPGSGHAACFSQFD